jgi:ABC-type branched-subunit amino acid transport system permease subunit
MSNPTSTSSPAPPKRGLLRSEAAIAAAVFAILALLPVVAGGYIVYILPQYMAFGVLAMSLALLWGFTGILSFGQAGFFAIGGYAAGLLMSTSGLPVNGFYLGLVVAALSGAVVAGLIGYFLFSAGVRDAYFVLVTLALSIVVEQIAVSQSQWTGGWNGMFLMRPTLTFFGLSYELFDDVRVYYAVLIFVVIAYVVLYRFTRGAYGKIVVGIRENELRMVSLGVSVTFFKTLVFAISAVVACLAGSVYAVHSGFVSPSLGGVLFSTEVVVWVAIAGRTSLIGALLGGIIVSSLSNYLSAITPAYWQLVLGFIFIAAIAYFRGGVAGAIERFFTRSPRGAA